MSRGVRYLGSIGRAELWRVSTARGFARAFPSAAPPPDVAGVWADVDGVVVRVPDDFGRFVGHFGESTGRAARTLVGRYLHADGAA